MRHAAMPAGLALLIGLASGITGYLIGMPLPWMLGSMLGVTIAALAHLPIAGPEPLRPIVVPVIGVMLGSSITAETLQQLGQWSTTILILPLALIGAAGASFAVYRRIGGYDPVTAFYCSMPGGLNEMLLMGAAEGGDERRIALAHAARVLMVIFLVALFFGVFMGARTGVGGPSWTALTDLTVVDYLILAACAALGVPLAKQLRLPAAPVFGPLILSGATHVLGWVTVAPPTLVIIVAQIVVGTIIGTRFIGATLRELGRDLALACLATLLMLIAALAVAILLTMLITVPLSQAFLAYAPGGLTEMALLTLAIDQDVAFVSVTHIVRIALVIAIAPAVFNLLRKRLVR